MLRKARLVTKGYTQNNDIDYKKTFSPVFWKDSLRIIIALGTILSYTKWM